MPDVQREEKLENCSRNILTGERRQELTGRSISEPTTHSHSIASFSLFIPGLLNFERELLSSIKLPKK